MFEGFETLLNVLTENVTEKTMKFREQANYLEHFNRFGEALKAYYECKEKDVDTTDGLDDLMLEAYRFMKFIRSNNKVLISQFSGAKSLEKALADTVEMLNEPLEHCVPMFHEVDSLETLSFSIFKKLKEKEWYCKHCKKFLDTPCKKHKEPSSVDDLYYCKACGGYLNNPCENHTPAAAVRTP